jgi:elongation factor 3
MPAITEPQAAAENAKSAKVLDELMQKLSISTDPAAVREASLSLASFVNGRIEDQDTPTK